MEENTTNQNTSRNQTTPADRQVIEQAWPQCERAFRKTFEGVYSPGELEEYLKTFRLNLIGADKAQGASGR